MDLPADSTVPRATCGEIADMPLALGYLSRADASLASDTLHASALAAVLWWDRETPSLDKTIQRLSDALRLEGDSVPLLVDLSAVHLFRAQETQNPLDLVAALSYSHDALAIEPRNQSALFNAALASEALHLDVSADSAWSAYLAADRGSAFAAEARAHQRALRKRPAAPRGPAVSWSIGEVEAYAANHAQEARELGWNEVLGEWGRAVLDDSTARAASLLAFASRLGTALARRPGGDASLADAVEAIRRAGNDHAATAKLAAAHSAYASGQALFLVNGASAQHLFARALELGPHSPALVAWARVFGADEPSDDQYRTLLAGIDTVRYPALAARIHWMWGRRILLGARDFAGAEVHLSESSRTYWRLGEMENYGAVRSMEGSARYGQGDTLASYRMAHQAAAALHGYHRSPRLHNVIYDLAQNAARDGMLSAALAFQDEDVAIARQVRALTAALPQALQLRADFYMAIGDTVRAKADLDSASMRFRALHDASQVAFLTYSRAIIGNHPAADVDAAVAFFTRENNLLWRTVALAHRANLWLARDDLQRAGADLDSITAETERASQRGKDYHLRSAVVDQARSSFDQLVMLYVDAKRPREALRALERGRVSFVFDTSARLAPDDEPRGPPGQVVVEYALIGDTLLAWTVRGTSVTLDRSIVDRDALVSAIERVDRALEQPGREALAQPLLERLHAWLMWPVLRHLPDSVPLVIVADGEIGRVPFPVLRDARTGRDLVEENHTLRFASRLADAGRREPVGRRTNLHALLVADPAFDPDIHPTLLPLEGARAEIASLRALYPGADTLTGGNASIDAFRARVRTAEVIHYAGHAVFDDTRPERSFLVLSGADGLPADTISRWDLHGVRIVVLSACSTIRARHGRSGGFAGLSGAFLSAGAGGVVGSLWKVSDRRAQPLMETFHREYQATGDPADALRKAQLKMRSLGYSPAVWAGFRYVGG